MTQPVYTVIAGANGAGKTSLYGVLQNSSELGVRVNTDEMVMSKGSWQDSLLQVKAGRAAMQLINDCISQGVSFHQETTLPGSTTQRQLEKAKASGFRTCLYFVGIEDIEIAIERVHRRVAMGGHGVDDRYIRKRFERLTENLRSLLPYFNTVVMYDNTFCFRQIAVIVDNRLIDCDRNLPNWFIELLDDIPT